MPPSIKNPSEKLLLQILTGVVSVLGSLLLAVLTLAWNGIDTRLANIESSFLTIDRAVVQLQGEQRHMEQRIDRHDFMLAQQKD